MIKLSQDLRVLLACWIALTSCSDALAQQALQTLVAQSRESPAHMDHMIIEPRGKSSKL
jgi:hypothetical protein